MSHNYIHILSLLSLTLSPLPTHLGITEGQAGLPVLYSNFSPAIPFTYDSVHMLKIFSPFFPLSASLTVSASPLATSASPFLPYK